ncbi:hypothetical protein U0070_002421, partial [Myodes glareolus]
MEIFMSFLQNSLEFLCSISITGKLCTVDLRTILPLSIVHHPAAVSPESEFDIQAIWTGSRDNETRFPTIRICNTTNGGSLSTHWRLSSSSDNERNHSCINNPVRGSVPESSLNQNIAELYSNIPDSHMRTMHCAKAK